MEHCLSVMRRGGSILCSPSSGVSTEISTAQQGTAEQGTAQRVTERVRDTATGGGGGGRRSTDSTVPLTSGESGSEPSCMRSTGTVLGAASSQEAVALPGRQGACTRQSPQTAHGKQTGVPAVVTVMVQGGQSALSDCFAGESVAEPRAVTAGPHTGVAASNAGPQSGEHAAHVEPGLELSLIHI